MRETADESLGDGWVGVGGMRSKAEIEQSLSISLCSVDDILTVVIERCDISDLH